jgi:hypothetical protein
MLGVKQTSEIRAVLLLVTLNGHFHAANDA